MNHSKHKPHYNTKEPKRSQVESQHESVQRTMYLEQHEMSMFAQSRIHEDCAGVLARWKSDLRN